MLPMVASANQQAVVAAVAEDETKPPVRFQKAWAIHALWTPVVRREDSDPAYDAAPEALGIERWYLGCLSPASAPSYEYRSQATRTQASRAVHDPFLWIPKAAQRKQLTKLRLRRLRAHPSLDDWAPEEGVLPSRQTSLSLRQAAPILSVRLARQSNDMIDPIGKQMAQRIKRTHWVTCISFNALII